MERPRANGPTWLRRLAPAVLAASSCSQVLDFEGFRFDDGRDAGLDATAADVTAADTMGDAPFTADLGASDAGHPSDATIDPDTGGDDVPPADVRLTVSGATGAAGGSEDVGVATLELYVR